MKLPPEITDPKQQALMREMCEKYAINPDPEARPLEVMAWKFRGDPQNYEPMTLTVILAGGHRLMFPTDAATEDRLRHIFGCFRRNARTGKIVVLPLPTDVRLPLEHRTGIPNASAAERWERA